MPNERKPETASDELPMFPMLWGYNLKDRIRELQAAGVPYLPICMPREMLDPHDAQAQKNHGQSIKRLAERGGLAPGEALAILDDSPLPADAACAIDH